MARILLQVCLVALVASMVLAFPGGGEPREFDAEEFLDKFPQELQDQLRGLVNELAALGHTEEGKAVMQNIDDTIRAYYEANPDAESPFGMAPPPSNGMGRGHGFGKEGGKPDFDRETILAQLPEAETQRIREIDAQIEALGEDQMDERMQLIQEIHQILVDNGVARSKRSPNGNKPSFDRETILSQLPEAEAQRIREIDAQIEALGEDQIEERRELYRQIHQILVENGLIPSKRSPNGNRDGNGRGNGNGGGNGKGNGQGKNAILDKLPEPYKSQAAALISELETIPENETDRRKDIFQKIKDLVKEYRATQE